MKTRSFEDAEGKTCLLAHLQPLTILLLPWVGLGFFNFIFLFACFCLIIWHYIHFLAHSRSDKATNEKTSLQYRHMGSLTGSRVHKEVFTTREQRS